MPNCSTGLNFHNNCRLINIPLSEKLKAERASYLEYQKIQRQIETLTRLVVAYKFTRAEHVDQNAAGEVVSLQDREFYSRFYIFSVLYVVPALLDLL